MNVIFKKPCKLFSVHSTNTSFPTRVSAVIIRSTVMHDKL